MEVDTISLITPPQKRGLPNPLVAQWLTRDASQWICSMQTLAHEQGLSIRARQFRWGERNVTEELPTDIVAYFVYQIDDRIAPEISTLLYQGRVHMILILSELELPRGHNLDILPIRAQRQEGSVLYPMHTIPDYGYGPLIQLHELHSYNKKNMQGALKQLLAQKEYFGN